MSALPDEFVLDTSVAAQFVLSAGDLSEPATRLLTLHADDANRIVVPEHFFVEFGNVLRRAVAQKAVTERYARQMFDGMRGFRLTTTPDRDVLAPAFEIAIKLQLSFYDALFAAVAQFEEIPLVTADRRLVRALAASGITCLDIAELDVP